MNVTLLPKFSIAYHGASPMGSLDHEMPDGSIVSLGMMPRKIRAQVQVDDHVVDVAVVIKFFFENPESAYVKASEVQASCDTRPVTGEILRAIPVQRIVVRGIQLALRHTDVDAATAEVFTRPTRSKPTTPREQLRLAAEVYEAAKAEGRPTSAAVAEALKLRGPSRLDAARQRIKRARQAGYLPPVNPAKEQS